VLPLLSQPAYYQRTRYGYARGHEPVRYVQRVRNYEDLLRRALDSAPTDFAADESGAGSDERERGAG
jgi:membrane-bound lytic murein transglycosylase F